MLKVDGWDQKNERHGVQCLTQLGYNLYSKDRLYLVCDVCDINNYADDNTICVHGNKIENVLLDIEFVSNVLMN